MQRQSLVKMHKKHNAQTAHMHSFLENVLTFSAFCAILFLRYVNVNVDVAEIEKIL